MVRSLRCFGDDLFSSWYLDKDSIGGSIFYLKSILWAHLYYFNFFDLAIFQAIPKAWTSSHVHAINIAVEVLLKFSWRCWWILLSNYCCSNHSILVLIFFIFKGWLSSILCLLLWSQVWNLNNLIIRSYCKSIQFDLNHKFTEVLCHYEDKHC